jgi:hypothetical protein
MFEAAVCYAKQLVSLYHMSIFDACRNAAWEYCVDYHQIYRELTE